MVYMMVVVLMALGTDANKLAIGSLYGTVYSTVGTLVANPKSREYDVYSTVQCTPQSLHCTGTVQVRS